MLAEEVCILPRPMNIIFPEYRTYEDMVLLCNKFSGSLSVTDGQTKQDDLINEFKRKLPEDFTGYQSCKFAETPPGVDITHDPSGMRCNNVPISSNVLGWLQWQHRAGLLCERADRRDSEKGAMHLWRPHNFWIFDPHPSSEIYAKLGHFLTPPSPHSMDVISACPQRRTVSGPGCPQSRTVAPWRTAPALWPDWADGTTTFVPKRPEDSAKFCRGPDLYCVVSLILLTRHFNLHSWASPHSWYFVMILFASCGKPMFSRFLVHSMPSIRSLATSQQLVDKTSQMRGCPRL